MAARKQEQAILCYLKETLEAIEDAELSDEAVGKVFLAWCRWAYYGKNTRLEDPALRMMFAFLRNQTERDRERYARSIENGKKGGRPRKDTVEDTETEKTPGFFEKTPDTKRSDTKRNETVRSGAVVSDAENDEESAAAAGDDMQCAETEEAEPQDTMAYISRHLGKAPSGAVSRISRVAEGMDDSVVRRAMEEAVCSGHANWNYFRAVLERYRDEGLRSISEIEQADRAFRDSKLRKGGQSAPRHDYQQRTYTQDEVETWYMDPSSYLAQLGAVSAAAA